MHPMRMAGLTADSDALAALPTPALVLDRAALERNIAAMADAARRAGVALRPHAKTHKSVEIAVLQIRAGAIGIACATVAEAEALAGARIGGLLLTTPVMGKEKFARLGALNRSADISVVVDHAAQLDGLRTALRSGDRPLRVLIDVDVGQRRTGITEIADAVRLSGLIAEAPCFAFAGIQGFAGNAQHIQDPGARREAARAAADKLRRIAGALTQAGRAPAIITGSGTGTYLQDATGPYTELQAGSYLFMDADYARIVDERGAAPAFEPSLFVLASVVSVNRTGEVTVDAGTKALATNGPAPCVIRGAGAGVTYRFAGDEHGILTIPPGQPAPPLGTRVLIGATHCDPTVNLHGSYVVVGEGAPSRWPIHGRYA